jgi:predicted transcriptional regulator
MRSNWEESDLRILLYSMFIVNKTKDTPTIDDIAQKMGVSQSTLYKCLEGEKTPAPEFFPALFNNTKEIGIIQWFVNRCEGLELIETKAKEKNGDLRDDIEGLVIDVAKISELRRIAYADGRLDSNEKSRLLKSTNKLLESVEHLLEEIKNTDKEQE